MNGRRSDTVFFFFKRTFSFSFLFTLSLFLFLLKWFAYIINKVYNTIMICRLCGFNDNRIARHKNEENINLCFTCFKNKREEFELKKQKLKTEKMLDNFIKRRSNNKKIKRCLYCNSELQDNLKNKKYCGCECRSKYRYYNITKLAKKTIHIQPVDNCG